MTNKDLLYDTEKYTKYFYGNLYGSAVVKNLPAKAEDTGDLGLIPESESSLEEGMATHSSVLAWKIPGTGELGGLPSMGSHRVGHN